MDNLYLTGKTPWLVGGKLVNLMGIYAARIKEKHCIMGYGCEF